MAMDGSQFKFKSRFTPSEKDRNGPPPGVDPRTYVPTGLHSVQCIYIPTGLVEGIGFGCTWEDARDNALRCAEQMMALPAHKRAALGESMQVRHYRVMFAPRRRRTRAKQGRSS
jgi:hypothetical protein